MKYFLEACLDKPLYVLYVENLLMVFDKIFIVLLKEMYLNIGKDTETGSRVQSDFNWGQ